MAAKVGSVYPNRATPALIGCAVLLSIGGHSPEARFLLWLRHLVSHSKLNKSDGMTRCETTSNPAERTSVPRNPREIAVVHAVSVHTVRTQLKRAMSKAGVHTQSALVASVYSVVS
jgi:hypothetical protein